MSENKYYYLAEPFDVLFFRNNKAFDFGEWYSEGFFPPLPSTFQGFVRTSILIKNNWLKNGKVNWNKASKIIGDDASFPFEVEGPYLFSLPNNWYFVAPRDIIKDNDVARQTKISDMAIQTDQGMFRYSKDYHKEYYLCYGNELISLNDLSEYRRFGTFCYQKKEVVKTEEHYGISLEKNKAVKEHHFYLTPYNRLDSDTALYFHIIHQEKLENLEGQTGRLGSEGRGAVIRSCTAQLDFKLEDQFYKELALAGIFKLILLQPGILEENWLPFPIEKNSDNDIILKHGGMKLKLLYVQTDQSLKISGMNFKKEESDKKGKVKYDLKPMVNAVAAGSTYYFEIIKETDFDEEKAAEILKQLDGSKISNDNYSRMGYNQVVLGKII